MKILEHIQNTDNIIRNTASPLSISLTEVAEKILLHSHHHQSVDDHLANHLHGGCEILHVLLLESHHEHHGSSKSRRNVVQVLRNQRSQHVAHELGFTFDVEVG